MKMSDMGPGERPREKMLSKGADALSEAELLAIILRTGTREMNVVDLSRTVIKEGGGSLVSLSEMTVEKMMEIPGIGSDKAVAITAALELGRRFVSERSGTDKVSITSPGMIYDLMSPLLKGLSREECWAIYLNRANYITGKERICIGDVEGTMIDINKISMNAFAKKSSGVILVHNHPSGNPRAGRQDIAATSSLRKALNVFRIKLLDHIIISDGSFFSFNEDRCTIVDQDPHFCAEK